MTDDEIAACPECDHAPVTLVAPGGQDAINPDAPRHRCPTCGARFETPTFRESKRGANTGPRGGAAQRLLDADPNDYPK